jgi:hypothetical protein
MRRYFGAPLPGGLPAEPQFEVFRPVIVSDSIFVVDILPRHQVTPKGLLHHETVFKYISGLRAVRMLWRIAVDVALFLRNAAALPHPIRIRSALVDTPKVDARLRAEPFLGRTRQEPESAPLADEKAGDSQPASRASAPPPDTVRIFSEPRAVFTCAEFGIPRFVSAAVFRHSPSIVPE